jgi:hypothetical protein
MHDEASVGHWAARYAGILGNSIRVSSCLSANAFQATMEATANVTTGNSTVIFSANVMADAVRQLQVGDLLRFGSNGFNEVVNISATGLSVTLNSASALGNATAISATGKWFYADSFQAAPGTSTFASQVNGSNDEMHVMVIDRLGRFSGLANTTLEKYAFVSKASDARTDDGSSNYYRSSIADKSAFIYNMDHYSNSGVVNWGNTANSTAFTTVNRCEYTNVSGGADGPPSDAEIVVGYDQFRNDQDVDISLIMTSDHSPTVQGYVISNLAEYRADCVAFISPPRATVVDNRGDESTDAGAWKDALTSSSYYFTDSAWKYQFDKYNNTYRWLPFNGDTAGLAARTDTDRDAWWSFAGLNRGQYKNVIKISWNPSKTYRDELYKKGINPVVTFPGEGTVLFGDKTGLAKPSAFDRVNVRRLFIVLRKAISKAARYSLFEFNDEFTRAAFVNMVEPFLRDVKGRRGLYDFKVVCDERNNTPVRIDRNEFWADIYLKPARSINFIILNFIATPTGVSFEEVIGKF